MNRAPTSGHRLLIALLEPLWRLKLQRSGFKDIEYEGGVRSEPALAVVELETGAEFFRQVGRRAWGLRNGTDRKIALAISEGCSWRKIKRDLGVGQARIERVLFKIAQGRKIPWHRRPQAQRPRRDRAFG